ncbi:transposase-like zinc-binding domain-containing protein [Burkholderia ubonensis]|uniref:IS1/IS1595 family N-terminal zinc-binding domain-containing protein n=1 Tax=Burkholderia ubonensis TaxID=101571 RepID=UPI000A55FC6F
MLDGRSHPFHARMRSLVVGQFDALAQVIEHRWLCGRVVKNGRAHGLQHYFCLDCNRTSIVTTNTSLAKLRQ